MARRRSPTRHPPIDVAGRNLRAGDWVRVVTVPESIALEHPDTRRAFSRAVGKTFQIEAFNKLGWAELDLFGKVGRDAIFIEPLCVRRVRRPRKQSPRFRKVLKLRRKIDRRFARPRWMLRFVVHYRRTDDPVRLVARLQDFWSNFGAGVRRDRREIDVTFDGLDRTLGSKRKLEQVRKEIKNSDLFPSLRVGRVRLSQLTPRF
jgi:hypothetical protein